MKPTYQQIDDFVHALTALGGTFNKVIQHGNHESVEPVPYRFGGRSKVVRQAAAHNLRMLRPLLEEFNDLRNALLLEVTDGRGAILPHERELNAKYNMRLRDLQRTEIRQDLPLEPIAEEDLNLDQNPIPPAVLATLALIAGPAQPPADA